jgi:hypothetical protein
MIKEYKTNREATAGQMTTDDPHEVKEQIKHNLMVIEGSSWTVGQREDVVANLKAAEVILKDLANELSKPKLPEVLWEGQVEHRGFMARILKAEYDVVAEWCDADEKWHSCSSPTGMGIFKAAFVAMGKSPK